MTLLSVFLFFTPSESLGLFGILICFKQKFMYVRVVRSGGRNICKNSSKGLLFDRFNLNLLFRLVKSTVQLNQALIKKQILTAETNSTLNLITHMVLFHKTQLDVLEKNCI